MNYVRFKALALAFFIIFLLFYAAAKSTRNEKEKFSNFLMHYKAKWEIIFFLHSTWFLWNVIELNGSVVFIRPCCCAENFRRFFPNQCVVLLLGGCHIHMTWSEKKRQQMQFFAFKWMLSWIWLDVCMRLRYEELS